MRTGKVRELTRNYAELVEGAEFELSKTAKNQIGAVEFLKENGANIVSLGKRILRTETAAISCTAVISQILENN